MIAWLQKIYHRMAYHRRLRELREIERSAKAKYPGMSPVAAPGYRRVIEHVAARAKYHLDRLEEDPL